MKLINRVSNKNSTACRALSHLYKQDSHYMSVLKFKDFSRTFKDPEVAFSRTNSRQKFTARTVLQQHLISVSVITGQF